MKSIEILQRINAFDFEGLKDVIDFFLENMNNNFTRFFTLVAVIVALGTIGYSWLKTVVKKSIEKGIEDAKDKTIKVIEEHKQIYTASGSINVLNSEKRISISGIVDLSVENFVNLVLYKKSGEEMIPFEIEKITNGTLIAKITGNDFKYRDENGKLICEDTIYWKLYLIKN